jgi:hypothetical protein
LKEIYRKDSFRKHYHTCHPDEELPAFLVKKSKSKDTNKYQPVKFNIKSKKSASSPPRTQFGQTRSPRTEVTQGQDILQDIMKALTSLRQ